MTPDKLQHLIPCPVCGVSHGMKVTKRIKSKYYMPQEREPYYEVMSKQFDPDKPLGVILRHRGRSKEPGQGGNEFVGTFQPHEDPDDLFWGVKRQLVLATASWIRKGWLSIPEIEAALADLGE